MSISRPKYLEPIIEESGQTSRAWWRFFEGIYQVIGAGDGPFNSEFIPTGTILNYGGTVAPEFYLLCDGSSYLVSDYQNLFDIIGYSFGGSGVSFLVPPANPFATGVTIIKT